MSSLAVLVSPPRPSNAQPTRPASEATVVELHPRAVWQRSGYAAGGRSRYGAGLGALAMVGGLFLALLSAGAIGGKGERTVITAVRLSQDLPPPPPPPAAAEAPPQADAAPISPLAPPPPLVTLPQVTPLALPPAPPAPVSAPVAAPVASQPAPAAPAAPAAAQGPAIATGRDLTANLIAAEAPRYPLDSRRNREQGTVVLLVTVGPDGKVASIALSRSSGFDRLDRAALGAVRNWRWSPLREAGVALTVQGLVHIPFVLQG